MPAGSQTLGKDLQLFAGLFLAISGCLHMLMVE